MVALPRKPASAHVVVARVIIGRGVAGGKVEIPHRAFVKLAVFQIEPRGAGAVIHLLEVFLNYKSVDERIDIYILCYLVVIARFYGAFHAEQETVQVFALRFGGDVGFVEPQRQAVDRGGDPFGVCVLRPGLVFEQELVARDVDIHAGSAHAYRFAEQIYPRVFAVDVKIDKPRLLDVRHADIVGKIVGELVSYLRFVVHVGYEVPFFGVAQPEHVLFVLKSYIVRFFGAARSRVSAHLDRGGVIFYIGESACRVDDFYNAIHVFRFSYPVAVFGVYADPRYIGRVPIRAQLIAADGEFGSPDIPFRRYFGFYEPRAHARSVERKDGVARFAVVSGLCAAERSEIHPVFRNVKESGRLLRVGAVRHAAEKVQTYFRKQAGVYKVNSHDGAAAV